jgi:hypothetical protein
MSADTCDVAVIGAGPYGLSATAHLHAADGLDIRLYGRPMTFWQEHMPEGMLLRSPYVASQLSDPTGELTLDTFGSAVREPVGKPVPLRRFVDYGRWFQQSTFSGIDERLVASVETDNGRYRLELEDGAVVRPRRVVVAAGIESFPRWPEEFARLPRELVSHAVEHRSLAGFSGRRVAVIGGGQSALESAALLHEAGAEVEVLVRAERIYYLRRVPRLHALGPLTSFLFAPAEVGPAGISRLVSAPDLYRRLPRRLQDRFSVRSLRPAGAAWLAPRLADVPISLGARVTGAREQQGAVELVLQDGRRRSVDHVLLCTGYAVDVRRYAFLGPRLLDRLACVGGYPRLDAGFESSVPRLHFLGAPASWSFGPLTRFVAGVEFTAPALARAVMARIRRGE